MTKPKPPQTDETPVSPEPGSGPLFKCDIDYGECATTESGKRAEKEIEFRWSDRFGEPLTHPHIMTGRAGIEQALT